MKKLFFTGTQEHALMALVIREAEASPKVKYFGRTALQKVVYFLKSLGVPAAYQFEIHHYGPFCDQIGADVDLMIADGIVIDRAASPKYWNYSIENDAPLDELFSRHSKFVAKYSPLIKRVVEIFGSLDPRDLELYATLHYAYRYETARYETASRDAVLARFRAYKGSKFTDAELNSAFDAMVAAHLIEQSA